MRTGLEKHEASKFNTYCINTMAPPVETVWCEYLQIYVHPDIEWSKIEEPCNGCYRGLGQITYNTILHC